MIGYNASEARFSIAQCHESRVSDHVAGRFGRRVETRGGEAGCSAGGVHSANDAGAAAGAISTG